MIDRELQKYTRRTPWNPNDRERSSGYRDLHMKYRIRPYAPSTQKKKEIVMPTRNAVPQTAAIAPRRVDPVNGPCGTFSNEGLKDKASKS